MNELQRRLGPRGLVVLGFPCNQFGHQVRRAGRGGGGRAVVAGGAGGVLVGAVGSMRGESGYSLVSFLLVVAAEIPVRPWDCAWKAKSR